MHSNHPYRSLLPQPEKEPISTNWNFIPSKQLGGDALGYHWIDKENFVIFLLDVCGHGIGAALLSISVMNVLRAKSLPRTDFKNPTEVMIGLNAAFPMEKQNSMFFTIWYGVWNSTTKKLIYCSAGHPPALLLVPGKPKQLLHTECIVIGASEDAEFISAECDVPKGSQLYVFSDGVFEITKPSGSVMHLDEMLQILTKSAEVPQTALETAHKNILSQGKSLEVSDDYSLLQIIF